MGPELLCPHCRRWSPVDDRTRCCRYCGTEYHRRDISVPRLCELNRRAHDELVGLYARCLLGLLATGLGGWTFVSIMNNRLSLVLVLAVALGIVYWGVRTWRRYVRPGHPEVFGNPVFRYGIPLNVPETTAGERGKR